MLPLLAHRQGVKTRQEYYREDAGSPGIDPASPIGFVMPLADEAGFTRKRALVRAPVYKGNRKPDGVISGMKTADGENPYGLELNVFPRILKDFFGPDGYVRPGGGTTRLSRYFIPTDDDAVPGSFQIQDKSLESPVQILRKKGVMGSPFNFSYANEGVARYGLGMMGVGEQVTTDLGGTVTDYPYKAMNYFSGAVEIDGDTLVGMTEFSLSLDGGLSRTDAAFRDGLAASIGYGNINTTGRTTLMMAKNGGGLEENLNFYDLAEDEIPVAMSCMWADKPLTLATGWIRIILSAVRFSGEGFKSGGTAGRFISNDFQSVDDETGDLAAEKFSVNAGPYTLTTNNKLGLKVNGGATVPVTLGTASTVITLTQAVAAINGTVGLNGLVASEFNGRIMLRSGLKGAAQSIQIDTAQADSAHTILGFDGVAFLGYSDTPLLIEVFHPTFEVDF